MATSDPDSDPAPDSRISPRESLLLGATAETAAGMVEGRIRNISASGAFLETQARLKAGDRLVLRFRGVDRVEADVVRVTPKGVGVRFAEEIDPKACRKSVMPERADWTKDYVLCLREGHRPPRWAQETPAKRPLLR